MSRKRVGLSIACLGIISYSTWVLNPILNPGLSQAYSYVSELSVSGQPYAIFFQASNLVGSLLLLMGFGLLLLNARTQPEQRIQFFYRILVIIAFTGSVNAVFPMDCAPSLSRACLIAQEKFLFNPSQWVHLATALVMFCGLLFVQFYSTFYLLKTGKSHAISLVNLAVQGMLNGVIVVICLAGFPYVGIFQRLSLGFFGLWVLWILRGVYDNDQAGLPDF